MNSNEEMKVLQQRIKKWDDKENPLAKLDDLQLDIIKQIEEANSKTSKVIRVKKISQYFILNLSS